MSNDSPTIRRRHAETVADDTTVNDDVRILDYDTSATVDYRRVVCTIVLLASFICIPILYWSYPQAFTAISDETLVVSFHIQSATGVIKEGQSLASVHIQLSSLVNQLQLPPVTEAPTISPTIATGAM
jgi:hypothetical protein